MSTAGRTKRSQSNSKKQAKSESPEKVTETCFVFLIYDRTKEPQAKYWCGDPILYGEIMTKKGRPTSMQSVNVHFNFIEGELF